MKLTPTILAGLALALFAAGCGDSKDDKAASDSGARGYAETGQAVNDVCKRAKAEVDPIGKQANGNAKHDAPIIEKVIAANDRYVAELKAIKPDPKLQSAFDEYVAAVEETQAKAKDALVAAKSGDDAAYKAAAGELSALDGKTHPPARALGAADCAKD